MIIISCTMYPLSPRSTCDDRGEVHVREGGFREHDDGGRECACCGRVGGYGSWCGRGGGR